MESTYDYRSGKATLGFHVIKKNELCKNMYHTPTNVGGTSCMRCKHHVGEIDGHVLCDNERNEDSKDFFVKMKLLDELRNQALCALCY